MVDVKMLLINTLSAEFPYPVIQQGSLSTEDAYPSSFFTFFNNSALDDAFFDNTETETIWDFDLNFYSVDPVLVNTILLQAKQKLKAVGFIPDGSGHDVISDEHPHTGRGMNLLYIDRKVIQYA